MSWHYLQGQEEASWAGGSMDGAPSALLSLLPTQGESSSQDNATESSQDSPSGMTLRRLTDDHGKDALMWYQGDSPVRTYLRQEGAQESADNDLDCGPKWQGSWAKYNPSTYSWKTRQCSLLGGLIEFSETFPRWGMMRSGEFWGLLTPGRRTNANGFGLWPTPRAQDREGLAAGMRRQSPGLAVTVKMWPTPRSCSAMAATITPESAWADNRFPNLETVVGRAMWPTPTAQDAKNNGAPSQHDRNTAPLNAQVGGALNPTWVEWLMGWPLFWTSLDTEVKYHYDSWHEAQQRTQTSPKDFQGGIVRNVWWDIDPSTASQGRQPNQQRYDQCDDSLPAVPCENSLLDRELGAGECKTSNLQDLRRHIQAEADTQIEAVRQAGLPKGKREEIGRIAVGVKNRADRLAAIGNGQVPAVVKLAWETLGPAVNERAQELPLAAS